MRCTLFGSDTSAWKKNASLHSAAVFSPASVPTSAMQTLAPSDENSMAASRPMPPAAPVMTATLPASRSAICRHEDDLHLRVTVHSLHAELAAEVRLLHAAERRDDAHRAVRVQRQHAGVDGPRHAERARSVAGPDRAGEAVHRLVGYPHGVGLVLERDDRRDRAEYLLARDPVLGPRL